MNCPVCKDPALLMTERQGVEIDYCPVCRGVWLDRGELDVIIDRSLEQATGSRARHDESGGHSSGGHDSGAKKKSSLFGDLLGGLGG